MLLMVLACLAPSVAATQESPRKLCYPSARIDRCRGFLVTEVAVSYPIVSPIHEGPYWTFKDNVAVFGDFGGMMNLGTHSALGATASFGWTGAA